MNIRCRRVREHPGLKGPVSGSLEHPAVCHGVGSLERRPEIVAGVTAFWHSHKAGRNRFRRSTFFGSVSKMVAAVGLVGSRDVG